MENDKDYVQVLFAYHSPVLDEAVEETLWAKIIDQEAGVYELASIPFYGLSLATADHFEASYDEDKGTLVYRNTVRNSGNSIVVAAIVQEDFDQEQIITALTGVKCKTEKLNANYFAVEVPKDVFYGKAKDIFDQYEGDGVIEYAEARLSAKHQSDLRRHKRK